MSVLPDPGPEPARVRQRRLEKEQLKAGAIGINEAGHNLPDMIPMPDINIPSFEFTPRAPLNPLEQIAAAIQLIEQKERVDVHGPFGKISFSAMHVSSHAHGLAFIILKDHMSWEPNVGQELEIAVNRQTHKVFYAGGYFTFRQMPFIFLSFVKVTDENERGSKQDGEDRSSRSGEDTERPFGEAFGDDQGGGGYY